MNINLKRTDFTENSTISDVTINGNWVCYVLEDKDRQGNNAWDSSLKVKGKTAIPRGTYEIAITFSNRFQKYLPLLIGVPDFEGIRIHPGNKPEDTEGCLLPGQFKNRDMVTSSKAAFSNLFALIQQAVKKEKVFITIE